MAVDAPAASALAMSPEYCRPPSAITGTPAGAQAATASRIAVICGAPTPATTRVVQMEPGPTPTLTASAPASTNAAAALRVATLPPMTSTLWPTSPLSLPTMSSTRRLCAWAVSTTSTSTPASASVMARSQASSPTPTAAPTSSRPSLSLVALGCCSVLTKSFTVISPVSRPCPSTMGSFSILLRRNRPSAASADTPSCAVISGALVITSDTFLSMSTSKRMSRLVMIPTRAPPESTTGSPEMRNRAHMASTSARVLSGEQVTGSVTMPASERLTISTWPAWSATERLRCSTPIPPARAIAMAIRASVTVSIAELTRGTRSRILRVSWLAVSAVAGTTSEAAGSSRTSSKVRPSIAILCGSSPPVRTPGLASALDIGAASISGCDPRRSSVILEGLILSACGLPPGVPWRDG